MKDFTPVNTRCSLALVVLSFAMTSCVTHMERRGDETIVSQIAYQPLFSACSPTDGAALLSLKGGSINIAGLEMVWNIPNDATWDMQFNSPLGDTQMEVARRNGFFVAKGLKELELRRNSDGALMVGDITLPVLDHEFPCLVSGHWPASWLRILREVKGPKGQDLRLAGDDGLRSLSLSAAIDPRAKSVNSCTDIRWGGFLGLFRHESRVCLKRWSSGYSVNIDGPSNYNLKWFFENDSN